jgi:gliding motility-associated transport system permease protein
VARLRKEAAVEAEERETEPTPALAEIDPEAGAAPPPTQAEDGRRASLLFRSGLPAIGGIAGRELAAYFLSPVGWIVIPLVLVVVSLFGYVAPLALAGSLANLAAAFGTASFLMLLFVPAFTMRSFAEERRQGTLELLLTSPVRDWEAVLGKWLGCFLFTCLALLPLLAYALLMLVFLPRTTLHVFGLPLAVGNLDFGLVASGYLGLAVEAAVLCGVGVMMSALTGNQVIALIATWVTALVLWYIGNTATLFAPGVSDFLSYVGGANRYDGFSRGAVGLKDVTYFATLTLGCLFVAVRVLESRRWRG